ncbi:MAG: electron transfer flavoprotein subunit alpha/FixB family protein [Flavobacteriales bacterium]|jgi:electron transfer flavoprotein alpha subunit|nr:electron transfer flavoprotein subunit alpha/FixB family protein [Flavobacteriales bacterium]MDG1798775.1 electron transfer flavoprotein subunit alpha/FixB family protein [Flavobacteriales bacterium]
MSVLVFVEINNKLSKSVQEAITYGKNLGAVTVVTYGDVNDSLLLEMGNYGAESVLVCRSLKERNEQLLSKLIVKAVEKTNAEYVILSQDQTGKAVGPRVAANLGAGHISGAIAVPESSEEFTVKTNVFSGKAIAYVSVHSEKKVISVLPNSIPPKEDKVETSIVEFNENLGEGKIKVTKLKPLGDGIPLPEAELVVSAGRGLKGPENWGIVEDLAKSLGATTACSRPVADIGWRPHHEHVGQTGVAIRPNLYVAAGISGAIQHLAGVNGSKVIVVVNTDPEAPFFKAADYGVIGDAFEVLPRLTASINNFKSSQ